MQPLAPLPQLQDHPCDDSRGDAVRGATSLCPPSLRDTRKAHRRLLKVAAPQPSLQRLQHCCCSAFVEENLPSIFSVEALDRNVVLSIVFHFEILTIALAKRSSRSRTGLCPHRIHFCVEEKTSRQKPPPARQNCAILLGVFNINDSHSFHTPYLIVSASLRFLYTNGTIQIYKITRLFLGCQYLQAVLRKRTLFGL